MSRIILYFKQLPKPIRLSYAYIGLLLGYNAIGSFIDSKNKLIEFRENKLPELDRPYIKDDWSAVKYGAGLNSTERLFNSVIWPAKIISNLIPFLVFTLNPPNKKKD